MERGKPALDAERFAQGMTVDQYVLYTGGPENLAREAGRWLGTQRRDFSGLLCERFERARLDEAQTAAIRWLAARADGPAKLLVISEEWSSDCRRDVPMLARLAEAGGLELRVFQRDGRKLGRGPRSDPAESPNADIVNTFFNEKDGQTFQSVPTAAFLSAFLSRVPLGVLTGRPLLAQDGVRFHDHRHGAGSDHATSDRTRAGAAHPRARSRDRGQSPAAGRPRHGHRQRPTLPGRAARG